MTAPVRTVSVKFTAEGSQVVQQAIARVTAASTAASERSAQAATAAAGRAIQGQRMTAASYDRSAQAAERAARRVMEAQTAAAQRTGSVVSSRTSMVAQSMATSMHMISETGQATGDVLRRVATDVSSVALMMGVGGPLMLAVGLAGMAIVGFFNRARAERKKLEDEAIAGLKRLQNAGDLDGMMKRLMDIDRGTPGEGFKDSLSARRKAIDDLRNAPNPFGAFDPIKAAAFELTRLNAIKNQEAAVKSLKKEYDELAAAIMNFQQPNTLPKTAPIVIKAKAGSTAATASAGATSLQPTQQKSSASVPTPDFAGVVSARLADGAAPIAKQTEKELLDAFRDIQSPLSVGIADSLVSGIAGGIAGAIMSGSIGEGIRSLAQTILAGLADVFAQVAAKAIAASTLMIKFMSFLSKNPWTALAAAVALMVLSRSMGAGTSSAGGAGMGGVSYAGAAASTTAGMSTRLVFGNNSVSTAAGMTPRQANNITIIGPDDPRAQRAITELLGNAEGRGLSTGGSRRQRGG